MRSLMAGCWLLFAVGGCAQVPVQAPLAGTAWDVRQQRIVPFSEILQQAGAADIVLLGETHDHPDHHVIETAVLSALVATHTPTVVLEQYDLDQQVALDASAQSAAGEQARLAALQHLMGAGWEWPGYRPLLEIAVHSRLAIVAANAPRAALRQVSKEGFAALGPGRATALGLDTHWSAAQQALLGREIADGHCGTLPPQAVTAIALAQRARDAVMADRILAQTATPVVAILGRGHVRRDLGVPVYFRQRSPDKRVIAIGLVEAARSTAASDYDHSALGELYDFVVFTQPLQREIDPCTAFGPPAARRAP